ncbi:Signal recognition particle receptor FtsY [Sodalis glossinidius str. 'morsitans']|uniref:Signal recognition particle receptor FtsY n=1 Tax=Sodalis glossinidius (strain morsitans) TaxID=343509 RepID=Q2NWW6_SODGM|nr:signal recognition particle-docking protein FtsY [Sodalis glossinidius]BAE73359.1 cell division protein [Sodalis glossinidius str. 'morsitans']CRL43682.1 Signal recognition particle receptor FtsY [Sodalis glossinidius str. 'morsitans']
MAKEKKRSFFSWLGFNCQDDDAGSEPQAERETDVSGAGGETVTPVAATAARDETAEAVEPALPQAQVERPDADRPSAPPAQAEIPAANRIPAADEPVPPMAARGHDAQRMAAEIVSLTEQVAARQDNVAASERKSATGSNTGAAPSGIGTAATPDDSVDEAAENRQDASAELTLAEEVAPEEDVVPLPTPDGEPPAPERAGFFTRLKNSLVKTRQNLGSGFIGLFRGKKIDDDLFEELEEQLLVADVGVETTRKIIDGLIDHADRRHLKDAEALYSQLRAEMATILVNVERPLEVTGKAPFVILMVGVNGVGKTTTIGKLARLYQAEGKSVMLAAGDTFRAAAVEQLQVWGERNHIPVIAQQTGADSASVIFDSIQAAKARGIEVLIADTAGRLQNKAHLMDELKKIVRVMKKLDVEAPHEVMLTLDASTGQNAVSQANLFNDAVGLTGIALTKLDGTAKGGVIFAVADRFGIPIRFIGVGEAIEDLRPFKADDFIEALFARED